VASTGHLADCRSTHGVPDARRHLGQRRRGLLRPPYRIPGYLVRDIGMPLLPPADRRLIFRSTHFESGFSSVVGDTFAVLVFILAGVASAAGLTGENVFRLNCREQPMWSDVLALCLYVMRPAAPAALTAVPQPSAPPSPGDRSACSSSHSLSLCTQCATTPTAGRSRCTESATPGESSP
jgi:hypothetical protein